MNVVVLQGQLSSSPIVKVLESGSVLMNLELTTRVGGVACSVPLVWFDPSESLLLASGDHVSLVGIQRQSRTATSDTIDTRYALTTRMSGCPLWPLRTLWAGRSCGSWHWYVFSDNLGWALYYFFYVCSSG